MSHISRTFYGNYENRDQECVLTSVEMQAVFRKTCSLSNNLFLFHPETYRGEKKFGTITLYLRSIRHNVHKVGTGIYLN